jgi:nitrite reductase/ring-hydroxylating ferredoxin subunit
MSFVRNAWYVAGWSTDFGDELVPLTLLAQNLVAYRTSDGQIAVLEDRCPHRLLPLSKGKRIGDTIQCGYHGMTFGADGACVRVPGQSNLPKSAYVDSYPVRRGGTSTTGTSCISAQITSTLPKTLLIRRMSALSIRRHWAMRPPKTYPCTSKPQTR